MPLTIRPGDMRDLDVIVDFNQRLAWETERFRLDSNRIRAGVTTVLEGRAEAHYLVAELNGEVVGQMMFTREWSDWRNGWFYWIQSVYVIAEARRQGVFRALYSAAVRMVEEQPNAVGLRLYVEEHNHPAQQTYLRLGMETAGYLVLQQAVRNALRSESRESGAGNSE